MIQVIPFLNSNSVFEGFFCYNLNYQGQTDFNWIDKISGRKIEMFVRRKVCAKNPLNEEDKNLSRNNFFVILLPV